MATLQLAIDSRKLITEARRVQHSLSGIQSTATRTFNRVKRSADIALGPLKAMIKVTAAMKASMIALGAASIGAAGDYEVLNLRMRKVIGSAREADRAFRESLRLSSRTPYSIDEIVEVRIALEQMGVRGIEAVQGVADAAAAMGRDVEAVAAALRSLEVEPLRNLGLSDRDLDVIREIKSTAGYEPARQAVLDIFDEYAGATEELSGTWQGLVSTMKDNIKILRAEFGEGFLDESKLLVKDITKGAQLLKDYAREAGQNFGDEMLVARAYILSGFDTALKVAGQIKDAMQQEGGVGQVILESFRLATTIMGRGIITAFEVSLPLWQTIGSILGNGVLNALYQSGIPGADALRGVAIKKNVQMMEDRQIRNLLREHAGYDAFDFFEKRVGISAGPGGLQKNVAARQKSREQLVTELTNELKKLPMEQQLDYAQTGLTKTVEKRLMETRERFASSLRDLGEEVLADLQRFANAIGETAGQEPIDILDNLEASFKKYMDQGERMQRELAGTTAEVQEARVRAHENAANNIVRSEEMLQTRLERLTDETVSVWKRAAEERKRAFGDSLTDVQIQEMKRVRLHQQYLDQTEHRFVHFWDAYIAGEESAEEATMRFFQQTLLGFLQLQAQVQMLQLWGGITGGITGIFSGGVRGTEIQPGIFEAQAFHSGGIVGSGGPTRMVDPSLFAFAPRLHNGLRPGEFPAILEQGERVTPKEGPAPVNIKIENNSGVGLEVGSTRQDFDKTVISIVAKDIENQGVLGRRLKGRRR
jgi:hypothetical protein